MFTLTRLAEGLGLRRQPERPARTWRNARPLRPLGFGDLHLVRLDGPVNPVSALAVEVEVQAAGAASVLLHINSEGGDLQAALALHWALRRHPWRIFTHVEDQASSAALLVALAGDVRRARSTSRMLIHRSSCGPFEGNASELRALSYRLESWDLRMAVLIAGRARRPLHEVQSWMEQSIEFSALEAKEHGIVHQVEV